MREVMDEIDEAIIRILKENSRKSYKEIGKEVGLSEGAIRKRILNLIKSGIIGKFTITVEKVGVRAITLVATKPSVPTPVIANEIAGIKGVETVFEVTGEYDITATLYAPSIEEINRCVDEIRRVEGVSSTNTMIILRKLS